MVDDWIHKKINKFIKLWRCMGENEKGRAIFTV